MPEKDVLASTSPMSMMPSFEVLIGDDEPDARDCLLGLSSPRGECAAAANGRTAVAEIERATSRFGLSLS